MRLAWPLVVTLLAGAAGTASAADNTVLDRGRYLVEQVGMCSDCHSPRDQTGQFIRADWLHGAPIGVAPKAPMPEWAEHAPQISGLPPHYTEAQAITFLESGKRPDGSYARPPMPPYRFNHSDAVAVAAYLKSLR